MKILKKAKEILLDNTDIFETAIAFADAKIGHGENKEKKAFAVKYILLMLHIPIKLNIGFTKIEIADKIVEIIDDILQQIFDKLKASKV